MAAAFLSAVLAAGAGLMHAARRPNCSAVSPGCRTHICDARLHEQQELCSLCICRNCHACLSGRETLYKTHPSAYTTSMFNRAAKQAKQTSKAVLPRIKKRKPRTNGLKSAWNESALRRNSTNASADSNAYDKEERAEEILRIGEWIAQSLVMISCLLFIYLACLLIRDNR
ncbi:hypothetical protein AB1Y20_022346 [Prymnesium parvum]|uniref:B box-type domain-containing protein n=1 Tax=Prymnesium parvum TaxID=97485 RepID=A0AB34JHP0_PRYPA|mmetsp:Transcript_35203/g.80547  ORF Transcript_35203/g.80547 Transcript_35203/m.80547 type:complete len:171 (+) Transcript_35203:81-593(+)